MSQSRLQSIGDQLYYSPNCDRALEFAIDPFLQARDANPFQPERPRPLYPKPPALPLSDTSLQNPGTSPQKYTPQYPRFHTFCTPRVWTLAFGWLAFVQMRYWDSGYPFIRLKRIAYPHIETPERSEPTYTMPQRFLQDWAALEAELYDAVTKLKSTFEAPMILPFLPWAHGYRLVFKKESSYNRAAASSRNWFSIWWGALSYLIAYGESKRNPHGLGGGYLPLWSTQLESVTDVAWLDGVFRSSICDYSYNPFRVGCILDITNPQPEQPPVSWFIEHGIPVWYRWGPTEASANPNLAPPPEAFTGSAERPLSVQGKENRTLDQRSSPDPFIQQRSIARTEPIIEPRSNSANHDPVHPIARPEPAWVAHFKYHDEMHKRMLEKETPVDRQAREARAANPPVSKVRVYEWWPSEADPDVFERVPAGMKYSRETLDLYSASQKIFDPFCREWDCCAHFGEDEFDPDEWTMDDLGLPIPQSLRDKIVKAHENLFCDDEEDENDDTLPAILANTNDPEVQSGSSVFEPPRVSPPVKAQSTLVEDEQELFQVWTANRLGASLEMEVNNVLGLHYGFAAPLPSVQLEWNDDGKIRKQFVRLLGLGQDGDQPVTYFTSTHYHAAAHFMLAHIARRPPPPGSWDLRDDVASPLRLCDRFRHLRILDIPTPTLKQVDDGQADQNPCYYYFDFPYSTKTWKIALLHPVDALFVCRLAAEFTEDDIVFTLLQRGISFRLFVPRCPIPVTLYRTPQYNPLPVRSLDHQFTKADYESYLHTRTLIFGQPHMQAALRRGGVIWRLAVATLGLLNAPKTAVGCGSLISVKFPGSDKEYVEDGLTDRELDLICGGYLCIDEKTGHTAMKSWWPLARAYERADCGENYGRWCSRREEWYLQRLSSIENAVEGFDQPLTFQQWKSSQRGLTSIRHFHQTLHSSSLKFIQEHKISSP